MATGGLYGSSGTGALIAQPSSESSGLYGNSTSFGGTYFEWFVFQTADTQPATPTGGTWDFATNTNTPPVGWVSAPPSNPLNTVWVSIAVVSSKNTGALVWSAPGKFAYSSGLPILSGSGVPSSGAGQSDQMYIQLDTTPQTIWFKETGTWTRLTGSSLYADLTSNQTIAGTKTFSSQIQGSISGTASNVTGTVSIANGGTDANTANGALSNLGGIGTITSSDGSLTVTPSGTTVDIIVQSAGSTTNLLAQVRNQTGATLTKGTVVYISGGSGNKALVSKALATGDATSASTFGMITSDISNNQNGYVTISGIVSGLNTSAYPDGTILYLSPTTAGEYTATKPYAPEHLVYVGVVTYSHINQGSIQTRIQNGYELDELHNVAAQSPTTGQTIVYNSATSLWEKSNAPVISGTTINNTTIGATTPSTGAFTTLSSTGNTTLGDASTDTVTVNGYMGVGTAANNGIGLYSNPSALSGTSQYSGAFDITGTSAATTAIRALWAKARTPAAAVTFARIDGLNITNAVKGAGSTITDQYGLIVDDQTQGTNNYGITSLVSSGTNKWNIYASGTAANYFAGNVGIGTSSPGSELEVLSTDSATAIRVTSGAASTTTGTSTLRLQSFNSGSGVIGSAEISNTAPAGGQSILAFSTSPSGNAPTERMRIDSSGNVGIGTSSPTFTSGSGLEIERTDANATVRLQRAGTSPSSMEIRSGANTGEIFVTSNSPLLFATNGTERMRLDSSGNLGIGTSSPQAKLSVSDAGAIGFEVAPNFTGGIVRQIAFNRSGAAFVPIRTQASQHEFYSASGEVVRIDSSGNLLVGTTSRGNVNSLSFDLDVATGTFYVSHPSTSTSGLAYAAFGHNGTTIGSITQSGTTAVAYNTTSDYRLKENVQPMIGALARVAALKPCTYTWKSAPDEIGEGFIAHELAEVCPQAVTGEKDAVNEDGSINPQSIDTSFLIATLTAALQEAHGLIKDQATAITALTARVEALESN